VIAVLSLLGPAIRNLFSELLKSIWTRKRLHARGPGCFGGSRCIEGGKGKGPRYARAFSYSGWRIASRRRCGSAILVVVLPIVAIIVIIVIIVIVLTAVVIVVVGLIIDFAVVIAAIFVIAALA